MNFKADLPIRLSPQVSTILIRLAMAFVTRGIYNSPVAPFIEFIDVHKSFGDRTILDGVSFTVEKGTTFAILGPSGIGKTVTITHIVGLLKPDSGTIIVDGQDVTSLTENELAPIRKKVQLVFQSGALFDSMTVWENVAFPLEDTELSAAEVERRVQEKLTLADIEDIQDLMPSELSTGVKRAVAIARALAVEPQAILYDEPTTMVDPLMSQTINDLIRKMQRQLGMTQVVVTHDIANCAERVADRVALLDKGRFAFIGTMAELYASDNPVVREFVEEDRIRFAREKEFA
ncbi:MAG TPA: ATP-binding cassette domain-containing protein [Terriglobia bacterium]|nr:ATP-binding cassette domain-containing protein [Terriglobia bacterium]